jgi:hypothetical protein
MFRHLPGHDRVKRKRYNLIKQNSNKFIDDSRWSAAVSPGSIVVMSIQVIVSVTDWEIHDGISKIVCPGCHKQLQKQIASTRWCVRLPSILFPRSY